jgi:hypothetical protein
VRRGDHAGGKWRLAYTTAPGRQISIEVDVNFMLRTPLWSPVSRDSHPIGGDRTTQILTVDDHELAAGKLAALMARSASRDIFDARELLRRPGLNRAKLRLGFDIAPELLTPDADMQTLIRDHPGLKWKALNRKKRLGIAAAHEPSE